MSDDESVASQTGSGDLVDPVAVYNGPLLTTNIDSATINVAADEEETIDPGEAEKRSRSMRREECVVRMTNGLPTKPDAPTAQQSSSMKQHSNEQHPPLDRSPVLNGRIEMQTVRHRQRGHQEQARPDTPDNVKIPANFASGCGFLRCKTMNQMWIEAGSLKTYDKREKPIIEKAGIYGDRLRILSQLGFVVMTDRRFMIKQIRRFLFFNYYSEEGSYYYPNLQHVGIERGLNSWRIAWFIALLTFLTTISSTLVVLPLPLVPWIGALLLLINILGWIYGIIMLMVSYNTNFLVIDISKTTVVGSWFYKRGGSFVTMRVPLPVGDCFEVMNELIKLHPLTPSIEEQV